MSELDFDVLVVGAGLSGIGAGYRLKTELPGKRFAILESRDAIGGTWDLFRYPGVRSDSDMFTLGYPFHPWKRAEAIADGAAILDYVRETARRFGIEPHIRFRHRIVRAAWSSADARWSVDVEVGETRELRTYRCRFLYLCSGYYDYQRAHTPELVDAESFTGRIVHPQWWPEDLDYTDKRVVVIGSGATAVTLVPSMAAKAAHVTMLQRSPSYVVSLPAGDVVADALRAVLPETVAHGVVRSKNVVLGLGFYQLCRRFPKLMRRSLRKRVAELLPADFPVDPHFSPRYDPWDQRVCFVPDADFFQALSSGKASVVTDTIERLTPTGLRLASGQELAADVIVTATGLKMQACGGIALEVDGRPIELGDTLVYKGLMLGGVPNFAWCVGYTNASWTLRADLSSRYVCRLIAHMDRRGHAVAVAEPTQGDQPAPLLDLAAGYVKRAADELPKRGSRAPWTMQQNYLLDRWQMDFGSVTDDCMHFSPAPAARA